MRINHNLMAMNANRQLGVNNNGMSKSLEKLSSGLRINRAGDDAAGLAISEKMRGQIRGLNQASANAQDGISLIQTAEGALDETHSILQRMRELAVQSSTDTNTEADRAEIQKEVDQLAKEITRIAEQTEFNTQTLLDSSYSGKKFHIGANTDQNVELSISNMSSDVIGAGAEYTVDSDAGTIKDAASITYTFVEAGKEVFKDTAGESVNAEVSGYYESISTATTTTLFRAADEKMTGETVTLGVDVSKQSTANTAIDTLDKAVQTVSGERSKLGAMQNRLEHTIKNVDNTSENLQAAESRIRDVDMAKEMMEFTKTSILQQSAIAMLAQANSAPQGVLQLLG